MWTELHEDLTISNGHYSVNLGSETTLDLDFDEPYWIGITVESDSEMAPRQRITAAGYAYYADTANELSSVYTLQDVCASNSEVEVGYGTSTIKVKGGVRD